MAQICMTPVIGDDLKDTPSQQMIEDVAGNGDPYPSTECHFTSLSDEMMTGVLRYLDTISLISCARVSRLLNLLAVQTVLDRQSTWRPENVCNVMVAHSTLYPPDVLSALTVSLHIKKMSYVSLDLTRIAQYPDLEIPLSRLCRLIDRLESVNDVAFHFAPVAATPRATSDKELKRICHSFGNLLNLLILKSCTTLQFANLNTSPLGKHYTFKRGSKSSISPSILTHFKGYLKASKDSPSPKAKPLEEDTRYVRTARMSSRMIHILPSPQVLEISKLVRFDTASINIFRPPFSVWTFAMLNSSTITHFSVGLRDLPVDKEETQYILDRLAASLPNVILLTIYNVLKTHVYETLAWLNSFPKIGTLSLPLNFTTDFCLDKVDITLPELWRLECAPSLLKHLFSEEGRVNAPKLNSVAITQYGIHIDDLAVCIPKAREVINERAPGGNCYLFLALRLTESQIRKYLTPALREGIRPTHKLVDLSKGFEGVSPLEVSLPGTREDIRLGIYDTEIMGLLTLFPDVKSLILSSTEWYLRKPAMNLDRGQLMKFRKRSPGLHTLVAY